MDAKCVICGEIIIPHRYYRKAHKTCRRFECMKAYRRQRASVGDLRRRRLQRSVEEQNGQEMVTCAVCAERFELIQNTHLKRHGLTIVKYKELYPDAPLMTQRMREIRRKGSQVQSQYLTYEGKQADRNLFEFLLGSLLGDGSLEKRSGKRNARYAEGGNNKLYLRWKYNFLSQYFQCSFKERISSPHSRTGKCYQGWWIRTTVHPLLTEWHRKWYKNGKKTVPLSLVENYLTDFSLAVWFCDDGCSTNGAKLYTMAFSEREVVFLSKLLLSRFGLDNKILKNHKQQLFIRFYASASVQLKDIVASFSIPGMEYKANL